MALTKDVQQAYNRYGLYIDELRQIMIRHGISGGDWQAYWKFSQLITLDKTARAEIANLLKVVAALDGGKASVATIGMLVALAIGGVGVAAMGSAFGVPAFVLALLGTTFGALIGNELDGTKITLRAMQSVGLEPDIDSSNIRLGYNDVLSESAAGYQTKEGVNGAPESLIGEVIVAESLNSQHLAEITDALGRIKAQVTDVLSEQYRAGRLMIDIDRGMANLTNEVTSLQRQQLDNHNGAMRSQSESYLRMHSEVLSLEMRVKAAGESNLNMIQSAINSQNNQLSHQITLSLETSNALLRLDKQINRHFFAVLISIFLTIMVLVLSIFRSR